LSCICKLPVLPTSQVIIFTKMHRTSSVSLLYQITRTKSLVLCVRYL